MDRMFEQTHKLYNDAFTFWTTQATQVTDEMMGNGEKVLKVSAEVMNGALSTGTRLFDALSKHTTAMAREQGELIAAALRPKA